MATLVYFHNSVTKHKNYLYLTIEKDLHIFKKLQYNIYITQ